MMPLEILGQPTQFTIYTKDMVKGKWQLISLAD
jgi:hypothetical protein